MRKSLTCIALVFLLLFSLGSLVNIKMVVWAGWPVGLMGMVMLVGALGSCTPAALRSALGVAQTSGPIDTTHAREVAGVFHILARLAVSGGAVALLLGLSLVMHTLSLETTSNLLGDGMAMSVLGVLYAIILSELLFRGLAAEAISRGRVSMEIDAGRALARSKLVMLIVGVLVTIGVIAISAVWRQLLSLRLLLVVGIPLIGIFLSHTRSEILDGLSVALGSGPLREPTARRVAALFARWSDVALAGGLIATQIELILALAAMADPDVNLWSLFARAMLIAGSGMLLSEVGFRPMASRILGRAGLSDAALGHGAGRCLAFIGVIISTLFPLMMVLWTIS